MYWPCGFLFGNIIILFMWILHPGLRFRDVGYFIMAKTNRVVNEAINSPYYSNRWIKQTLLCGLKGAISPITVIFNYAHNILTLATLLYGSVRCFLQPLHFDIIYVVLMGSAFVCDALKHVPV